MSSFASIFTRKIKPPFILRGRRTTSCSIPSIRKRIRIAFLCGSMWISLASFLIASIRRVLNKSTIGASVVIFSRFWMLIASSSAITLTSSSLT